ncbi:MAG: 16S rRNA (guanine(527)-N(7))-methyltransferase RsmG [Bacteroidales bacterium]|nr:16S rRNA (guanine(527)-N(7))-methyltransferase RsmG [Bacteroidales bacterium]
MSTLVSEYFDTLSERQKAQFEQLPSLYSEWNAKINVVSRKDIEQIEERHILHSLGIAKYTQFVSGTKIVDVGTGGGFPGIPLAIMFPEVEFLLVDSIGKKVKVAENIAAAIGLTNVRVKHSRSEEIHEKFDFIVSRAVTAFPDFVKMTRHLVSTTNKNACHNGILYLKGGDFDDEIKAFGTSVVVENLTDFFKGEFFETKKIIHLAI